MLFEVLQHLKQQLYHGHLECAHHYRVFHISNIDKEINKELPEDDLVEDRNMLECFLKYFK